MEKSLLIGDHLFVSKLAYGPRMPNTPIAFPFTQHTMPITKGKSWSNLIQWPYKRLAGLGKVNNGDAIVFNFPAGDTVALEEQVTSYYEIVRRTAREMMQGDSYGSRTPRTVASYMNARRGKMSGTDIQLFIVLLTEGIITLKDASVFPGDSLVIKVGKVYIKGKEVPEKSTQQFNYVVATNGTSINPKAFERLRHIQIGPECHFGIGLYVAFDKDKCDCNFEIHQCYRGGATLLQTR